MAQVLKRNTCAFFDAAAPGTGPMGMVSAPAPSTEFETYNSSFDYSLKSKSDLHLNAQPEGVVVSIYPKAESNRNGWYAVETDRGDLYPTVNTQINVKGEQQFQNRLQDDVRPTMKETTLYSYDGYVAPVTAAQAVYSQFIPTYATINNQQVRIGGASNYGLRTATEYSYIPGAAPTGINGQAIQNPDAAIGQNTKPVADFNVDGSGTFKGAIPDGGKYQQYRLISTPTSSGLKFNYNLETDGGSVADYSPLLQKEVDGIENRYTASYQIAPLFTNPLNVIWDPDNKGTIPAFYGTDTPVDYSYMSMQDVPADEWVSGGYNDSWSNDTSKDSSNAYILGLDKGIHNSQIEWYQDVNDMAGVVYMPTTTEEYVPTVSYGGSMDTENQYITNLYQKYPNNTFTTFGSPNAATNFKPQFA
jgi:hypothetical protein